MSELVERLRSRARWDTMTNELEPKDHIDWQAADTIEQLQARVDELESTLKDTCDHSMKMAKEIGELSGWEQACKNESNARAELQKTAVDYGVKLNEANDRIKELEKSLKEQCEHSMKMAAEIMQFDGRNSGLQAALEKVANEYITKQVEGEEEWQWLDRELTATKEYARQALQGG